MLFLGRKLPSEPSRVTRNGASIFVFVPCYRMYHILGTLNNQWQVWINKRLLQAAVGLNWAWQIMGIHFQACVCPLLPVISRNWLFFYIVTKWHARNHTDWHAGSDTEWQWMTAFLGCREHYRSWIIWTSLTCQCCEKGKKHLAVWCHGTVVAWETWQKAKQSDQWGVQYGEGSHDSW